MEKLFIILFATILTTMSSTPAQNQLNSHDHQNIIEKIGDLLTKSYVFPDIAFQMKSALRKKFKYGHYKSFRDPKAFAQKLTADLRQISHDKHLQINYNPDWVRWNKQSQSNAAELQSRQMEMARQHNFGFKQVEILEHNIGYLELTAFLAMKEARNMAVQSMKKLENVDAFIIDLRQNKGGNPAMIQLLSSYLFDSTPRHLNSFYWRSTDNTTETWTLKRITGKRMPDIPVVILTSQATFSAAEEFTYNLKHMKRAIVIGEVTGGGAHPGGRQPATDQFSIWMPQGRAINPITQTNWEGVGVQPHIEVEADKALARAKVEILNIMGK